MGLPVELMSISSGKGSQTLKRTISELVPVFDLSDFGYLNDHTAEE